MKKIPAGYKKTEVGIIPEDWVVVQLRNLISKIIDNRGKTPPYTYNDPIELIETASINFVNQSPDYSKITKFVSRLTYDNWFRDHPAKNDLLISTVGEYSGSSSLLNEDRGTIAQNLIALRIRQADAKFVFYWTRSSIFKMQLEQVMMSHAQPSLRVPWLLNFKLSIPPNIFEQTAIATALNDTDALITQLEKLIAKKRLIKQGAMQQLLKPKPGWQSKKLGEILLNTQLGGNYPNSDKKTEKPLMKMGNIQRGSFSLKKVEYIKEGIKAEDKDRLKYGDVLFNTRNTLELVGKVAIWKDELEKAYFNSNLMRLEFSPNHVSSNFFMNYLFNAKEALNKLKDVAIGTTSVAAIYTRDLVGIVISLPGLMEQSYIADILSSMDAELERFEARLAKYKQIKQGMMQSLLTGKARLI